MVPLRDPNQITKSPSKVILQEHLKLLMDLSLDLRKFILRGNYFQKDVKSGSPNLTLATRTTFSDGLVVKT